MEDGCTINFSLSSFFLRQGPCFPGWNAVAWSQHQPLGLKQSSHLKHVCLANFFKKIFVELGSHYVAHAGGLPVKENPY